MEFFPGATVLLWTLKTWIFLQKFAFQGATFILFGNFRRLCLFKGLRLFRTLEFSEKKIVWRRINSIFEIEKLSVKSEFSHFCFPRNYSRKYGNQNWHWITEVMLVCNSKSLCRHLLCDVIEMEDLTPAGETSSLYPYGALSFYWGPSIHYVNIILEFFWPTHPSNWSTLLATRTEFAS